MHPRDFDHPGLEAETNQSHPKLILVAAQKS